MAALRRIPVTERNLQGLKYFKALGPLLAPLHSDATDRDRAGNRILHYDQYARLLLLTFFNPIITGLRSIQQASTLAKVQALLGCERAALGSLSEASRVFDPALLRDLIGPLAARALPQLHGREAEALRGLTAVDGSLLAALPKMAWALWVDDEHRAVKLHLHFDVLQGVPVEATVTAGSASETAQLRATLQADRLYVIDRGYAEYQLFQDIIDAGSSFIGRLRDNAVWTVVEERPVSPAAWAAGVRSDRVVRLGGAQSGAVFKQTAAGGRGGHGENRPPGPAGSAAPGHQPPGPGRRARGPGLSLPLVGGAVFLLVQVHTRLPAFAVHQSERHHDSVVPGPDRQLADRPVDRQEADQADLGNAATLLHGLGQRSRAAGAYRPVAATRLLNTVGPLRSGPGGVRRCAVVGRVPLSGPILDTALP